MRTFWAPALDVLVYDFAAQVESGFIAKTNSTDILSSSSFTWSHSRNRNSCVCHLASKDISTVTYKVSQADASREYVRLLPDANSTHGYICRYISMGCTKRLPSQSTTVLSQSKLFSPVHASYGFKLATPHVNQCMLRCILSVMLTKLLLHACSGIPSHILNNTECFSPV